jgi:hypothetical protein
VKGVIATEARKHREKNQIIGLSSKTLPTKNRVPNNLKSFQNSKKNIDLESF